MDRPNILSTILYCGENPIPQREPPNDDDEKILSGLLTEGD